MISEANVQTNRCTDRQLDRLNQQTLKQTYTWKNVETDIGQLDWWTNRQMYRKISRQTDRQTKETNRHTPNPNPALKH